MRTMMIAAAAVLLAVPASGQAGGDVRPSVSVPCVNEWAFIHVRAGVVPLVPGTRIAEERDLDRKAFEIRAGVRSVVTLAIYHPRTKGEGATVHAHGSFVMTHPLADGEEYILHASCDPHPTDIDPSPATVWLPPPPFVVAVEHRGIPALERGQ